MKLTYLAIFAIFIIFGVMAFEVVDLVLANKVSGYGKIIDKEVITYTGSETRVINESYRKTVNTPPKYVVIVADDISKKIYSAEVTVDLYYKVNINDQVDYTATYGYLSNTLYTTTAYESNLRNTHRR